MSLGWLWEKTNCSSLVENKIELTGNNLLPVIKRAEKTGFIYFKLKEFNSVACIAKIN